MDINKLNLYMIRQFLNSLFKMQIEAIFCSKLHLDIFLMAKRGLDQNIDDCLVFMKTHFIDLGLFGGTNEVSTAIYFPVFSLVKAKMTAFTVTQFPFFECSVHSNKQSEKLKLCRTCFVVTISKPLLKQWSKSLSSQ